MPLGSSLAAAAGAAGAPSRTAPGSPYQHPHACGRACGEAGLETTAYSPWSGLAAYPLSLRLQNQQPSAEGSSGSPAAAAGPPQPAPPPRAPTLHPAHAEGSSYAVYDAAGQPSSLAALLADVVHSGSYDVVLLGEYHDDPVAHHLQAEILRAALGGRKGPREGSAATGVASTGTGTGTAAGKGAAAGPAGPGGGGGRHGEGPGGLPDAHLQAPAGPARPVVLSLEMFEWDTQTVMDEYLAGMASEADLMKDARPWPNYPGDYRPLVLAAKEAGARVVCANAPRRYVGLVGRRGPGALAALPPASRDQLPPLPLRPPSAAYAAKIDWTMRRAREEASAAEEQEGGVGEQGPEPLEEAAPLAEGSERGGRPDGGQGGSAATSSATRSAGPGSVGADSSASGGGGSQAGGGAGKECPHIGLGRHSNFAAAQALWDGAMAAAIARALDQQPGALVLHVCGKFHCEQRLGIPEHLAAAASIPSAASAPAGAAPPGGPASPPAPPAPPSRPPRVAVVTFLPSHRGVAVAPEVLRSGRLETLGDWLVLTDGTLPRSFGVEHPV